MKLPSEFEKRMRALLGEEAEAYFSALDAPPPRTLRLNPSKLSGTLPLWGDMTVSPVEGFPSVFTAEGSAGGKNPLHHAGAYYIQEFSAMLPVLSAPIERGWRVLDLCAAPGGKTGQLAAAVGESGLVVTNEYSPKRAKILLGNVERLGHRNCAVYNSSPDRLCPEFAGRFDLVLVDAPCSGEGMFRREADAVADWSPENTEGCAVRQREILRSAAAAVKPGGYLLYSTCTFSPVEDEETVAAFLRGHPEFSPEKITPPCGGLVSGLSVEGYATDLSYRAYPHKIPGEGQFFCLLRRDTSPVPSPGRKKDKGRKGASTPTGWEMRSLTATERRACDKFLKEFFGEARDLPLAVFGGDIFVTVTDDLPASGLMCPGVRLGSIAEGGGRLIPAHHFFSAYGGEAALRLDLDPDSPLTEKYLHGEGFSAEECGLPPTLTGWGAVTVAGCALGGFRLAAGYVKNHYPKGLRT